MISPQEHYSIADEFHDKGYVVIDTGLEESVIDATVQDLTQYFGPDREHPIHVPSADPGRIQDAWYISRNVLKVATHKPVLQALESLYGRTMKPFQTPEFSARYATTCALRQHPF